jgi:hypothetical protein
MESNRSVQVSRPNRNFLSPFFGFVDWMSFCRGRVKWFRLFRLHRCMSFLDFLPPRWIFYLKNKEKDNFGWKLFLGQNCLNIWCILGFKLDWKLFFSDFVVVWFIFWSLSRILQFWLFYILGVWCAMLWWCLPISTPCSSGSVFLSPTQTSSFFHQPPNPKWRCNTQQLSRTETSLYPWQPQLAIGLQLSVSKKTTKTNKNEILFSRRDQTFQIRCSYQMCVQQPTQTRMGNGIFHIEFLVSLNCNGMIYSSSSSARFYSLWWPFFLKFYFGFLFVFYRFVCAGTHRHETHKTHNKNTWEKWSTQIAPSIIFFYFFIIFSAISFWFSWISFILMECLFLICLS